MWLVSGSREPAPATHSHSQLNVGRKHLERIVKRLFLALMAFLLVLNCCPLSAQFETASVLGYVHDASGAALSNATVSLINQETKSVVTSKTNSQGAYEFTDVKIGEYQVNAQADGFDTTTTQNFTVTVNARQRVDVSLKIGSASETVTVTGAADLLETDSSERGQVIGTREVENLPLNGRAYADLAALVPGVRRNILENTTTSSRDASFNINGQRSEFNNFLLDGVDNNAYGTSNQGFSNQAIPPSPDAINEFRVETDNYSAEYGRSAGGVINVSIRSGSNQFHGKAWDYLRNTVLNAVGPFTPPTNPLTGQPSKPVLIRNQFGGTFGGPIWKDHTFFFADYEGVRQITHSPLTATVPSLDQNGTSALAKANGGYTFLTTNSSGVESATPVPLVNPLNGKVYANGVIPFGDASPFAQGVLAALPTPTAAALSNNYASLPAGTVRDDKGDIRVDQTFNARTTAFVRYSEHQGTIQDAPTIQGPAGGSSSNGVVVIYNQQIAGGVTHTFSQNSILDARFAFTRTDGGKSPYGAGMPSLMAGITGLPTDPQVVRSLNDQSVNGYTQFGSQNSNPQFQNPWLLNPKINYTLLHGRNSYKFGYEYQAIFTAISDFNPNFGLNTYNGGFSYSGSSTTTLNTADTGTKEAVALADFLLGADDSYQLNNFAVIHLNQRMHFLYFQDDIRVNSRLTVNAGLRYELVTPQWESDNHLANFDPTTNSLIQASSGSIYNRALVNMPKLDFAPRFGLAFQADPKTVIRAGYGLGFAQFNREGGENMLGYNGPFIVNTNRVQVAPFAPSAATASKLPVCTTGDQPFSTCFRTTQQGFPTNFATPANYNTLLAEVRYLPKDLPTGYVQSYHLTVQRQLSNNMTFEVSYVGEHGVKLQVLGDYNQAAPNAVTANCNASGLAGSTSSCLPLQARRPVHNFTGIEETLPDGFLAYNALQTKFEHRTSHGLYILNSFTWSRAQDNASGHLDTPAGDNSRINLANPLGDRSVSAYNQPLNEILTVVYDLPYGKGRMFGGSAPSLMQEALGGWQLTAINSASSGIPVNLTYSENSFQDVSDILTYRPNLTGVPVVLPKSKRVKNASNTALLAFNPASVSIPGPNTPYGNAGRNSVRFDPLYNLDLGVHKVFPLYLEGTALDFRTEAFNILNKVNYAYPQSTAGQSTFGAVTAATTAPPRVLQFALKLIF
jgi:hypothetical protein